MFFEIVSLKTSHTLWWLGTAEDNQTVPILKFLRV